MNTREVDTVQRRQVDKFYQFHYLTPEGAERKRQELAHLAEKRLPQARAQLLDIVQPGLTDQELSEVERLGSLIWSLEERIREIRDLLNSARILESPMNSAVVQLGSRVVVVDQNAAEEAYRIVSSVEANPEYGYISSESPVGSSLLGLEVNDTVMIECPDGYVELRVKEIG